MCDRGTENATHRARADADRKAPQQIHLPQIAYEDEAEKTAHDQQVADEHDEPRSEPIDERSAEGTAQSEREDAERDRERDLSPRPAELGLERRDDDAGCGAHGLRREEREERHDDNDPRVVEALHGHSKV